MRALSSPLGRDIGCVVAGLGLLACGVVARVPRAATPPRPFGVVEDVVRRRGPPPPRMTLVGPDGTCPAARLEPVAGGLRVREACDAVLALDGELPQARLVPLRFEPLRSGRGRAGDGEGWTVRLEYGPLEGGSPGLPGHVQVKRDGAPILRHNTWLRVEAMDLLRIGAVTWLVLRARDAGEAFRLGSRPTERVSW